MWALPHVRVPDLLATACWLGFAIWLVGCACCAVLTATAPNYTNSRPLLQVTVAQVPRCVELTDNVTMRWGINNDVVTFAVVAKLPAGTTYFGIGLSEQGSMKGADVAMFNQSADGSWTLSDAFAEGFVRPVVDDSQDLKLLGVQVADGVLSASWQRHITPCDNHDLPIPTTTIDVIWAWGYHGIKNRGHKEVSFIVDEASADRGAESRLEALKGTPDVRVLELTFPVDIPARETTYYIKYFKLPSDRKYHIVHYEPIKNHKLLHHGVAYSCNRISAAKVLQQDSMGPFDTANTKMLCEQFYMVLDSGGHDIKLATPADAGLPMGTPDRSVVALELHYNNPEGLSGQKDKGSGIRVYYSEVLRKHDMGLLTLAQDVLEIPPGLESVPANISVCPSECTNRLQGPVTLLSGSFHMHGLGKSIITRRYRNGTELSPVSQLRSWEYAFQGHDPIPPEARTLLPGDVLTLQCTFDSSSRQNWTYSGESTQEEMCYHWISYYPAQGDMGLCYSFGDQPLAICAAEQPADLYNILQQEDEAPIMQLMTTGQLMPVENPADTATAYEKPCNTKPAV